MNEKNEIALTLTDIACQSLLHWFGVHGIQWRSVGPPVVGDRCHRTIAFTGVHVGMLYRDSTALRLTIMYQPSNSLEEREASWLILNPRDYACYTVTEK